MALLNYQEKRFYVCLTLFTLVSALVVFSRPPSVTLRVQAAAKPTQASGRLDLNQATRKELLAIQGIGPKLAAEIEARRQALQGFKAWEEVLAIKGIGPHKLKLLQAQAFLDVSEAKP